LGAAQLGKRDEMRTRAEGLCSAAERTAAGWGRKP